MKVKVEVPIHKIDGKTDGLMNKAQAMVLTLNDTDPEFIVLQFGDKSLSVSRYDLTNAVRACGLA